MALGATRLRVLALVMRQVAVLLADADPAQQQSQQRKEAGKNR
jgi:hypothetical protein